MRIAVLGASGVLGRHVIPRLVERGHEVNALVRTDARVAGLSAIGVKTFPGDILAPESIGPAVTGCDCVMHLATAIPGDRTTGDWGMNDRIRREGTRNLLRSAADRGVRRYIQQSITLLYGDCGMQIMDETATLHPAPFIQSAYDMEQSVQASTLEWCILRGGLFYGPSTDTEETWRTEARAGKLRIPGSGEALISLIHVVDMAKAVVLAAERASGGRIYNVVDDLPVSLKELYAFVARQVQAHDPEPTSSTPPSLGCSNTRLKSGLGWYPVFPTYLSGLA